MTTLPDEVLRFLRRVRAGLDALEPAERDEILDELRSHFVERAAQGRTDLLDGFDAPEDLAHAFVSERALRGALGVGTPWALARALMVTAGRSVLGMLLLIPLALTQLIALGCLLTAAMKPFFPKEAGLWIGEATFHIGIHRSGGSPAREVLGWWGIPVLVIAGGLLLWGSNRAMRALVRRQLQASRRTPS